MLELLKRHREALHMIPEKGYKEFKTKAYILETLKDLKCEIIEPSDTAVCAFFKINDGDTIALRCDMDALPNKENTGLPYSSQHENMMHSCGHDGHTAMLLGTAKEVNDNLSNLKTNVALIFQPAEEGGGGGEKICLSGILEKLKIRKIYAFHLWPGITKHTIASKPGGILAKSTEMNIIISGKSSHVADSANGIDALYLGCKFICDLYELMEEETPEDEFTLIKFGKMNSGLIRNSISASTVFEGTMRCFSEKIFALMLENLYDLTSYYEREYGCKIEVFYNSGYPAVINDAEVFEETKQRLSKDFSFETLEEPYMQAEDFSFYLNRIPGVLLLLGIGDTPPLHNDKFDFDISVLKTGVNVYKKLLLF